MTFQDLSLFSDLTNADQANSGFGNTGTEGTGTTGTGTTGTGGTETSGNTGIDFLHSSLLAVPQVADLVNAVTAVVGAHESDTTGGSTGETGNTSTDTSGNTSTDTSGNTSTDTSGNTSTDTFGNTSTDATGTTSTGTTGTTGTGSSGETVYAAELLPSNNSGANGAVAAGFDESAGTLTISVEAHGLTPNEMHLQHIHGFEDGTPSQLPTIANDTNHDGFIEDTEAEAAIGPVIMSATQSGQITSQEQGSDFPSADANGDLSFLQTYQFDLSNPDQASIFQELQTEIAGRGFEIHGLQLPAGESTSTADAGTYDETLPVTGGILTQLDHQTVDSLSHNGILLA